MKKRLIALVMTLCVMAALVVPVCAVVSEPDETQLSKDISTVNEYDSFKKLQEKSEGELLRAGLTADEVREIKLFSYEAALFERSELSDNELTNMGYSVDQIEVLRNYSGETITPDSSVLAAVPTLTATLTITKKNTTPASLQIKYNWSWSVAPVQTYTDKVGIQVALSSPAGYSLTPQVTAGSGRLTYIDAQNGNQSEASLSVAPVASSPFASREASFAVKKRIDTFTVRYAMRGYIQMTVKATGTVPIGFCQAYGSYGHATTSVVPSISIGAGISFSFSPSSSVTTMGVKTNTWSA